MSQHHILTSTLANSPTSAAFLLPSHGDMLDYLDDAIHFVGIRDVESLVTVFDLFRSEPTEYYTYYVRYATIEIAERHEGVRVTDEDIQAALFRFAHALGANHPDVSTAYYPHNRPPNLAKRYTRVL